jgi:filamentous hemagglutinin
LELKIPILRKNPSASSTIYSGGNVNFTVDSITNDISQIISSGNMHFSNSNVNNINSNINGSTKWTIDKCDGISEEAWTCGNTSSYLGVKGSNVQYWRFDQVKSVWNYTLNGALNIPTVIQSGGSITGNINKVNNGVIKESQSISGISKKNQNTSTTGSSQSNSINNKRIITKTINNKSVQIELPDITSQITLPKNNYGLFITSKNPNSKYLIESNPEFTLRANFISSDYMMEKIGFSPTQHTKKLGDAFYEQKLIRDQIFSQSGKAFLEKDIKSQQDQYTALMDNGVKVFEEFKGSELELVPGIALSKTQIDALTSDMVWMEEKIVNNQVVLVPQVYIANIESIKIDGANIIAGENIELQIADNMINKGNIAAGGDIDITAKNNIENISAEIKADNINLESKEGNIINKRFSKELDYSTNSALAKMTKVSDKGTIVANNNINIKANKSFENSGSDIKAKDINLQADDIKINTVKNNEEYKTHHIHGISKKSISSNIQSDNLTLKANNDITIEGSNLKASNNLDMEAKKVDILSAQDLDYKKVTTTSKKRFSKSSTTTTTYDLVNQSSNLNVGGKLTINTKDDTNLVSANIDAKGGANIKSEEGNVNVIAVKDIHIKDVKTQKSRFSLGISSKGISTMKIIKEHNNIEKQKSQGTLISSNKSLNIEAKENINLQGVTIDTQEGTILDGENVNIVHSEDKTITTHSKETLRDYVSFDTSGSSASLTAGIEYNKDKEKTIKTDVLSSSINTNNLTIKTKNDLNMVSTNIDVKNDLELDVGNNINVATAKNTIETTTENTKADINVKLSLNTNLKEGLDATKDTIQMIGDGTITKGIGDIANMVDSIAKGENPLEGNEDTINSANTLNNNYNTLQEGPSASSSLTANIHLEKSNTKNYQSQAVLNSMKVGNNAKLKTNQGDINLEGVKLDVKEELTLDSAKDITITSAKNTTNSDSKKDSFDGSYNLISQDITLSVNQDKSDSESIINVNSQINTNKLNIIAKNDTTLEGVNAQAQSVSVDVENLNVISQQDTQNSSSSSKGLTVGTKTIGANLSKQKENEVWTNNQTSLTGEVVTINVRNHTNTTGATIASQNQDGEDNQQLTLNTNTLTTTTLKDTSKSSNTGFGVNGNADKSTTNLTYGKSDKRQDTLATIGNGSINITDTQNSKIKELNRDITNTQKITKDKTIKTIGITVTQKSDELKAKEQENSWSKTGQRLGEGAAELVTNVGGSKETANEVAKAVEEGYEITTDKVNNVVKAIKKANGDTESSGVDIGLLPNKKNHGGFTEQIVSNFGDSDRDKKELHIVSTTNDNFSKLSEEEKATYKPIEETEYYKSLPQSKQDELKDKNLLLSETPSQSTFQNFTNGMANSEGEAIMNGLTQTHSKEQIEEGNINYTVNYNPTRGVVADTLLESSQEKINEFTQDNLGIKFLPTTATAKDTGNFIKETIKDRGNKGSNFAAHSQGNQHTKAGIENVQSNGGFGVSKKDFQRIDPNNPTKKEDNKPTYTGFGSPVNTKAMEETLQNAEIFDYKGMHTNKDDAVGEVLGGNKGKDEQMEPIERVKGISDFPKLFTDESPHSTYECDESKGMICGDRP